MDDMPRNGPASLANESALVERIGRGDHAAFEAMMRHHNGKLFRVARAILRDDTEAEDALQDAYLDAYRHIGDFRGTASLATWLHTIATSVSLNGMRSVTRLRTRSTSIDDVPELPAPGTRTAPHDLRERLHAAIDALSVKLRPVFVMHDVEGYTHEEIAGQMGKTVSFSKSQLARAHARLRTYLGDEVLAS